MPIISGVNIFIIGGLSLPRVVGMQAQFSLARGRMPKPNNEIRLVRWMFVHDCENSAHINYAITVSL